jgi:serine/threonine-protein kinase RsbW
MEEKCMKILNYNIESVVNFEEESIEKFLFMCESAIDNITKDKNIRFKLKSVLHELIINSIEHGYRQSSGKVKCTLRSTDDSYVIEIADEGNGIAKPRNNTKISNIDVLQLSPRGWGLNLVDKLSLGNMNIKHNKPKGTRVSVKIVK